jgi:DNA (cytosine-5)-methyltransferase 1
MANTENNVPRPAGREPAQTLRCEGGLAMVAPAAAVMRNNSGGAEMSTPAHEAMRTLTTGCHQSLVIPYAAGNEPVVAAEGAAPTVTTRDRLAMVVPFTRNGRGRDAEVDVAPTLATEGPPGLVFSEEEIDECRFRMFQLHEIARAMAFAEDYVVLGNKRERMAQYGNAVTPPAMELLVGRLLEVIE